LYADEAVVEYNLISLLAARAAAAVVWIWMALSIDGKALVMTIAGKM
jgi:hypothetical protein